MILLHGASAACAELSVNAKKAEARGREGGHPIAAPGSVLAARLIQTMLHDGLKRRILTSAEVGVLRRRSVEIDADIYRANRLDLPANHREGMMHSPRLIGSGVISERQKTFQSNDNFPSSIKKKPPATHYRGLP
jgi:hypothetical protein